MRIQSSKVNAVHTLVTHEGYVSKEKWKLGPTGAPPEHRGHQNDSLDPEVPTKLNSSSLSGLVLSSQHKSYLFSAAVWFLFFHTSAKSQYLCVVVWNIQHAEWTMKYLLWEQEEWSSAGVRHSVRRLKSNWFEDFQGGRCAWSFGDVRWQLMWTLVNGLDVTSCR